MPEACLPAGAPDQLRGAGTDTVAVCVAWFSMMHARSTLRFGMRESRPTARAQAALDDLVSRGAVSREDGEDGSATYRPLADFSPLQALLPALSSDPDACFDLVEPISGGGEPRATVTLELPPAMSRLMDSETFRRVLEMTEGQRAYFGHLVSSWRPSRRGMRAAARRAARKTAENRP